MIIHNVLKANAVYYITLFSFEMWLQKTVDSLHLTPRLVTQESHTQMPLEEALPWAEAIFMEALSL